MPIRKRTLALAAALLIGVAPVSHSWDFNQWFPFLYSSATGSVVNTLWITANSGTVYYVQSHTNLWDQALTNGYLSASNNWGIAKVGNRFFLMYSTNALTLGGHPWSDVPSTNGLASTNWVISQGYSTNSGGTTNLFAGAGTTGLITSAVGDIGNFLGADGLWHAISGSVPFTNWIAAGWGLTNSAAANSGSNTLSVYTNDLDLIYLGLSATASNAIYAATSGYATNAGDSVLFDGYDSLWFVATNHIGPVTLSGPLWVNDTIYGTITNADMLDGHHWADVLTVTNGLASTSELYKVKGTGTDVVPNWLISKILGSTYINTAPYDNGGHDEWVKIELDILAAGQVITNGLVT